jgi:putative transposase
MTNHVHLLLRPELGQSISRILQSLTVTHTWRYHKRHRSSGHVWQGRFKSPVIQDDAHLLVVLRYIETSPLRVGIVADPADYRWSSFPHHGLGRADTLVSGFPESEELGATEAQRRRRWWAKVRGVQDEAELAAVRTTLPSGRLLGTDDWTARVAERLNIDLKPRPADVRPRKK